MKKQLTSEQIDKLIKMVEKGDNTSEKTCRTDISSEDVYRTIVKNIKQTREKQGITQSELASMCGCSLSFLSLVERYQKNLSAVSLVSISRALGVPISTLAEDYEDGDIIPELKTSLSLLSQKEQQKALKIIQDVFYYGS